MSNDGYYVCDVCGRIENTGIIHTACENTRNRFRALEDWRERVESRLVLLESKARRNAWRTIARR